MLWVKKVAEIIPQLGDCGTRVNILAFDAELESAKNATRKEFIEATKRLLEYAYVPLNEQESLKKHLNEIREDLRILSNAERFVDENGLISLLERVAFKCNILVYYLKKENARTDNSIKSKDPFSDLIDFAIQIVSDIHSIIEKDKTSSECVNIEVHRININLNKICSQLHNKAILFKDSSNIVELISQEYSNLANYILCIK